ncbi:universal stress protein [uncultured Kriegella sp.]|uniref:universal stress protein n=1 Tax=uncultured Kriegella sp. TaxID=1798910 RepID=UPI0030D847FD|tara:strand:- start:1959 stop:2441 length:483 start_codon:yes stop_codon:yes gene_type:complete
MKKIIIPTDFTVESLQLIEYAILNFPDTKLDIILVHGFKLPDTRWGLTHFSALREVNKLNTDAFAKAKNMFVREHSDVIVRLRFELFTGSNSFAFRNFAEQLGVKDAIVPKGKFLHVDNSKCFDPTRFVKSNIDNVIEIPFELTEEYQKTKFSLSGLLNL